MYLLPWALNAVGGKREPKPILSCKRNMVSPYRSPLRGKPTAKKADSGAGKGRGRKRMPGCNRSDRSWDITPRESGQTSFGSFFTKEFDKTIQEAKQMAAKDNDAGAASHMLEAEKAEQNVRRLQARIVKAMQERKWNKVKVLQRLLTHSHSGRVVAVERVTQNKGKKTPGVDGET